MKRGWTCFALLLLAASTVAFGAEDSFRFVALGDSRGGDIGINEPIMTELADAIIAEQPELVLFPGDLVNDGTQEQLQHWVEVFMEPLRLAGIPVYPCRGNHDSSITAWNAVFSGIYALPQNGPPGEANETYSFVHKNALFIGLGTPLLFQVNQDWLDQQLALKTVPHVFVFCHYPAFHVDHVDGMALYPDARDAFWDSLGAAQARVYFTGHDHFYDHARAATSTGWWIHQYVAGTAGAPLYDWSGTYLDPLVQAVAHDKKYGYAVVDVNGLDVQVSFKGRVAPNVYADIGDTFTYTVSWSGAGVPAMSLIGVAIAVLLCAVVFLLRRDYARSL